jgi:hypothetical protein
MQRKLTAHVPIYKRHASDEFIGFCIVINLQQKIIRFSGSSRLLKMTADRSPISKKSQQAEQHDASQHAQHDINRHRVWIASYCRADASG